MKLRTPISDYYQYKERMKSLNNASFETQTARYSPGMHKQDDSIKGKAKRR